MTRPFGAAWPCRSALLVIDEFAARTVVSNPRNFLIEQAAERLSLQQSAATIFVEGVSATGIHCRHGAFRKSEHNDKEESGWRTAPISKNHTPNTPNTKNTPQLSCACSRSSRSSPRATRPC